MPDSGVVQNMKLISSCDNGTMRFAITLEQTTE